MLVVTLQLVREPHMVVDGLLQVFPDGIWKLLPVDITDVAEELLTPQGRKLRESFPPEKVIQMVLRKVKQGLLLCKLPAFHLPIFREIF